MFANSAIPKVGTISVDLDSLHLYYQIHGIDVPESTPSIYETGVTRFLDLFQELDIRATLFVVAEDALKPENRRVLERAVREGHELASHSFSHPYQLIRFSPDEIEEELEKAESILQELRGGKAIAGFRAPGYNTSPELLHLLGKRGYIYDSSFFPCPAYYAAKAGILGLYHLTGRDSQSILGNPGMVFSSRHPTRLKKYNDLLEFPMTVTPLVRFPVIGTSLIGMGKKGWKVASSTLRSTPFVQIEFHAIDMTDHVADGIDDALLRQPDQRVPLQEKLETFRYAIEDLKQSRRIDTLENLAPLYGNSG